MKVSNFIFIVLFSIVFFSCKKDYLPKPKGYNRIELPEAVYQPLPDTLPYFFEYSKYAQLLPDSSWITEPYWVNIYYPKMDASIQITYKPVTDSIREYLSDSYKLTAQHNVKAYAMEEKILELKDGMLASYTELEGEVPTQAQFHATDSTTHFLRGALYFKTATKNDSLAPVIAYLKQDIMRLLGTLEWKKR